MIISSFIYLYNKVFRDNTAWVGGGSVQQYASSWSGWQFSWACMVNQL